MIRQVLVPLLTPSILTHFLEPKRSYSHPTSTASVWKKKIMLDSRTEAQAPSSYENSIMLARLRASKCTAVTYETCNEMTDPSVSHASKPLTYTDEYYTLGEFTYVKNRKQAGIFTNDVVDTRSLTHTNTDKVHKGVDEPQERATLAYTMANKMQTGFEAAANDGVRCRTTRPRYDTTKSHFISTDSDLSHFRDEEVPMDIDREPSTEIEEVACIATALKEITFPHEDRLQEAVDVERLMYAPAQLKNTTDIVFGNADSSNDMQASSSQNEVPFISRHGHQDRGTFKTCIQFPPPDDGSENTDACGKSVTSSADACEKSVTSSTDNTDACEKSATSSPVYSAQRPFFFCSSPSGTCDKQIHKKRNQLDSDLGENIPDIFKRKKRTFKAKNVDTEMCEIMHSVFRRHGTRCSEALYQRAVVRRAYLDGLPVMMERELFADYGEGSLLVGRVDVEVAACCLYEFKVGQPNIAKDEQQVNTYLKAYDINKETIEIAALVYFTKTGVYIHYIRR
jgi:hypothetical protein